MAVNSLKDTCPLQFGLVNADPYPLTIPRQMVVLARDKRERFEAIVILVYDLNATVKSRFQHIHDFHKIAVKPNRKHISPFFSWRISHNSSAQNFPFLYAFWRISSGTDYGQSSIMLAKTIINIKAMHICLCCMSNPYILSLLGPTGSATLFIGVFGFRNPKQINIRIRQ